MKYWKGERRGDDFEMDGPKEQIIQNLLFFLKQLIEKTHWYYDFATNLKIQNSENFEIHVLLVRLGL